MRELFSFIVGQLTDPLTLPIDPLHEWAILGIIGLIAYATSFRIVGDMYHSRCIDGRFLGSLSHWTIRLLIFSLLWFVVYWSIIIVQWIIANWVVLLFSLFGIVLVSILVHRSLIKANRIETR